MEITSTAPPIRLQQPHDLSPQDQKLYRQAQELEATFLSEMLGYAGVGSASQSFSGGIGEEQFSSFLRQEQARMMVDRGGIGLAQQLFEVMRKE